MVDMIFELYVESGYDTTPLGVLTALLALPVTIDLIAIATPQLIEFIYPQLGLQSLPLVPCLLLAISSLRFGYGPG